MKAFLILTESRGAFLIEGHFCLAINGLLKVRRSDNVTVEIADATFWQEFEDLDEAAAALQIANGNQGEPSGRD